MTQDLSGRIFWQLCISWAKIAQLMHFFSAPFSIRRLLVITYRFLKI